MEPFDPDFEMIKMDAEVASYQEDFDSERDEHDGARAQGTRTDDASA